jgi:signal transduction histidine kinase
MGTSLVLFPAGTFLLTAALLGYVAVHHARSVFKPGVVAALVSILLWVGGMVVGQLGIDSAAWARAGVLMHFAGVCGVSAAFVVVAMRFARVSLLEHSARSVLTAVSIPGALCFAMVATNPWHGSFGHALDASFFRMGAGEWAGPLYPLLIGWVYASTGFGLLLCLRRAVFTSDAEERQRLIVLSLTASTPLIGYAIHEAGWLPLPPEVPVTTICLTATALIVVLGVTHYGFLDTSLMPLRDVIEHLDDGLLLADLEGTVVEANPAAAAIFGRPRADLVGARVLDLLKQAGDDGSAEPTFAAPGAHGLQAHRLIARDDRVLDLSCGWVRGRSGAPIGCFAVLGDRTDQQRHQQLRHRSQRLESLGVLLGGLAHEINNPLAYLRANLNHVAEVADQLEDAVGDSDRKVADGLAELRDVVGESLQGLERIGRVVANTATLAPRDAHPTRYTLDLNSLVEESIDLATRYARSSTVVEAALDEKAPRVAGDPGRLGQAFVNLIVNSLQAAPTTGGRVRVGTRALEGRVEVVIEDNGAGIPVELRERVFDPFFTTRGSNDATGLGLSIAHDVACEHGGEILLGNSALGGECFRVHLPQRPDPSDA